VPTLVVGRKVTCGLIPKWNVLSCGKHPNFIVFNSMTKTSIKIMCKERMLKFGKVVCVSVEVEICVIMKVQL